jgi:hypothetical protein
VRATGLEIQGVPGLQELGALAGLAFGHALVLLPLIVLLDVLALIGLLVVLRRSWIHPVGE